MSTAKVLEDILSRAGEDCRFPRPFVIRSRDDLEGGIRPQTFRKAWRSRSSRIQPLQPIFVLPPPERLTAKEMMAVGGGWEHQSGGGTDNNWQDHPIFHD